MVHKEINAGNVNEVDVIREDLRLIFDNASKYGSEYGYEVSMFISIIGRQINALYDFSELIENESLQSKIIDIIGEIELLLKTLSSKVNNQVFIEISDAIYTAKKYLIK
ncbi:hypothetical protein EDC17_101128 [Sphingobacterium alimentarium]|uniref:Uncharacterized protein n=1 Tax=Sphingobacterium alimentarium TaxID=797292 RepID=A0A4R3W0X2_9SPHI|nr:hypothetical protein [Sphingobacterium alimentarium]TCV17111.1 hypothetical protein EDC17_101128 [Sphingobacterium alimentarium]